MSNIQAGSDAADRVGQVFQTNVAIDTSNLSGFTYTLQ